jgi:hypothetical protein
MNGSDKAPQPEEKRETGREFWEKSNKKLLGSGITVKPVIADTETSKQTLAKYRIQGFTQKPKEPEEPNAE